MDSMFSNPISSDPRPGAVAIGNFDGFHLGHRKIITHLKTIASSSGWRSLVLTFSPNPKLFFKRELFFINTDSQKREILENQGLDGVAVINFARVSTLDPLTFVRDILVAELKVKCIVLGADFRFGRGREGDIDYLRSIAASEGFEIHLIDAEEVDGLRVSSSFIRKLLREADIPLANKLLGHPYFIDGRVVEGEGRGGSLGFPTVNIQTDNRLLPAGVFSTTIELGGKQFLSLTNIGFRPTFSESRKGMTVEAHIIDFKDMVYGEEVRIYFKKKLRDEEKFASKEALIARIREDVKRVKV